MSETNKKEPPVNLGIFGKITESGISPADMIAVVLSVFWLLMVGVFFLFSGPSDDEFRYDPLTFIMVMMAIFLPIAVIWIGAVAARSAQVMRSESARLQAAIDAMRHAYITQAQTSGMGFKPSVERKLDQIAAAQKQTDAAIVTFASNRDQRAAAPVPKPATIAAAQGQAALALGTPAEELDDPVTNADLIRALNFPEDENDVAGFGALRRALKDHRSNKLLRAAQDVLTLMSQDGIYTDDLLPDRARPEIWRKFAAGDRGRAIASLGGIRDRSSLALTAGRMKQDQVFRDAVHHFLREFDKSFAGFADHATDQEIVDLTDTRSARAFMLLGRVTGMFG